MTRWLFEYSQENFRRQQRINAVLFACIEDLAIENARLRRERQTVATKTWFDRLTTAPGPALVEGAFVISWQTPRDEAGLRHPPLRR